MTDTLTPVLTAYWDQPDIFTIDGYRRAGGWQALPKALGMTRDEVIAIVKNSGLRGRGGAGFPTGVKWGFLPQNDNKPHYLVVNGDESEPGACKDVPLMMATPHTLLEGAAPRNVANFVGLARGLRPFKDPTTSAWVKRPAYDGTTFHRIIKGFMIQGGDPIGDGNGDPGYAIADEIWPGATHDRAGLLCMANRGRNTNGAQFFITDGAAPHLDAKGYTIFGECSPTSRVRDLASWPVSGERALNPPVIARVTIAREKP